MLCEDCGKREAQVHLTRIINNQKVALALCKECAAARGFHSPLDNNPFPLAEILKHLAQGAGLAEDLAPGESITCETCKLTFEEFTRQGRFGCGDCYKAFRSQLETIMRKIHGASLHRGRHPAYDIKDEGDVPTVVEEERLDAELRKAIEAEDFERAAEVRDKLKDIRERINVEKSSRG
jgi:protein arginine kinase activator